MFGSGGEKGVEDVIAGGIMERAVYQTHHNIKVDVEYLSDT